jgi:hypothetical protein
LKFAYADPPYYKRGKADYGHLHEEAHVWDVKENQRALLQRLKDEYPDGWAMSCNPSDLSWLLVGHDDVRIAAWVKTFHQIRPTSVQYSWEPVLFMGGRVIKGRNPLVRDHLSCAVAMKKGLKGAKPDKFNDWILDMLGYEVGDQFDDLFVGTNSMGEAIERRKLSTEVIHRGLKHVDTPKIHAVT